MSSHIQSPSSGRFIINFNGVEKKIVLRRDKNEYQIENLRDKVFNKFKKLGTKDFHLKMNDGSSINTDQDIILYLLGQSEPLPKCSVFVGIPRFGGDDDVDSIANSSDYTSIYHQPPVLMHNNGLHNNSPISPLPVSFDLCPPNLKNYHSNKSAKSDRSNKTYKTHKTHKTHKSSMNMSEILNELSPKHRHGRLINNISNLMELDSIVSDHKHDLYQGYREYICRFNNILAKLTLSMFDIAKYSDESFQNRFLNLFDYKLKPNQLLQFRVYHISTKQYIAIKLPLWSYDSQHYHIDGQIIDRNDDHSFV